MTVELWLRDEIQSGVFSQVYLSHQSKNIWAVLQPFVEVFSSLSGICILPTCDIYPSFQDYALENKFVIPVFPPSYMHKIANVPQGGGLTSLEPLESLIIRSVYSLALSFLPNSHRNMPAW